MRVIEVLNQYLQNLGMSENQANMVIRIAKDDMGDDLRLCDYSHTYSDIIIDLWKLSIKKYGYDWIVKNKPQAWFRSMFK